MSPGRGWISIRRRPELLAAVLGVLVVLVVTAVLHRGARPLTALRAVRGPGQAIASARPGNTANLYPRARAFPHSPAGAALAAATYLLELGNAATTGATAARKIVATVMSGSLQSELEPALPLVAGRMRARLASAPAAFAGWPLGYRLIAYRGRIATVSVWHLDIGAASALGLMAVDYETTADTLRWDGATWRLVGIAVAPGPDPPPPHASNGQINAFVRSMSTFTRYRFVP